MSVELVRDMINYERLIGESSSQTMVDGDIVLAERNPEFSEILHMDGKVIVLSTEVVEEKVLIEGKVVFEILYSSQNDAGINKVSAASNFNHTLQIPEAKEKMSCKVDPFIDHMQHELISNRKIKVNAVININGIVYDKDTVELVSDIRGQDVQILKDSTQVDEFVGENSAETVIKARFEIPEDKSGAKSLLKTNAHVHKKDVSIQDGKVILNACAMVKVMYDNIEEGNICFDEQDVAFTHEMNMPDMKPDMKCNAYFKIGDIYDEIKENEIGERKIIEVEVVVKIYAKAYMKKEIQTILDAYSPQERYDFEKENIKVLNYLGENTDSQVLKERISLDNDKQPIANIKNITGEPVVTDVKIIDDKVLLEGILKCNVIYAVAREEGGMTSYEEEVPFKANIDMPGSKIDMIPEIIVNIDSISCDRASEKEIDVKAMVSYTGKVYYKTMLDVIKSISELPMPDISDMPSIIIYVVQHSDTLWKIAKKYYTTVDDIININEIVDIEKLESGMKLMIPKKTFMK